MTTFFSRTLRLGISVALLVVAVGLVACGADDDDGGKLNVVTTLPLFADMAANVAGDRADIEALLPAGADPHTYEPSPSDVRKVTEADVVFANGFNLEPAALRLIGANLASDAVLVELGEATVGAGADPIADEEVGGANPHLWMDVANAREYARIIRDTLVDRDPGGQAVYNAHYETYVALLADTEAYVEQTVAAVPEDDRRIVATHDAFSYLARAIDFEVAGFVAPGPGQEPSPEDISSLIQTIEEFDIPAVFSEPQTGAEAKTLDQIASDAGVEVCTLYSDAFDETVTTYAELMRYDAEEIARCLGGSGG